MLYLCSIRYYFRQHNLKRLALGSIYENWLSVSQVQRLIRLLKIISGINLGIKKMIDIFLHEMKLLVYIYVELITYMIRDILLNI